MLYYSVNAGAEEVGHGPEGATQRCIHGIETGCMRQLHGCYNRDKKHSFLLTLSDGPELDLSGWSIISSSAKLTLSLSCLLSVALSSIACFYALLWFLADHCSLWLRALAFQEGLKGWCDTHTLTHTHTY